MPTGAQGQSVEMASTLQDTVVREEMTMRVNVGGEEDQAGPNITNFKRPVKGGDGQDLVHEI